MGERIDGIHYQVKNDLLQLDAVTFDNQRMGNELSLQGNTMGSGLSSQNADHVAHNLVQVDISSFNLRLGEKLTESLYDIAAR